MKPRRIYVGQASKHGALLRNDQDILRRAEQEFELQWTTKRTDSEPRRLPYGNFCKRGDYCERCQMDCTTRQLQ